jgi:hypothetical protein
MLATFTTLYPLAPSSGFHRVRHVVTNSPPHLPPRPPATCSPTSTLPHLRLAISYILPSCVIIATSTTPAVSTQSSTSTPTAPTQRFWDSRSGMYPVQPIPIPLDWLTSARDTQRVFNDAALESNANKADMSTLTPREAGSTCDPLPEPLPHADLVPRSVQHDDPLSTTGYRNLNIDIPLDTQSSVSMELTHDGKPMELVAQFEKYTGSKGLTHHKHTVIAPAPPAPPLSVRLTIRCPPPKGNFPPHHANPFHLNGELRRVLQS